MLSKNTDKNNTQWSMEGTRMAGYYNDTGAVTPARNSGGERLAATAGVSPDNVCRSPEARRHSTHNSSYHHHPNYQDYASSLSSFVGPGSGGHGPSGALSSFPGFPLPPSSLGFSDSFSSDSSSGHQAVANG